MMDEKAEKLQRLTELSEGVCSLPLLAAKMEPVGEELVRRSRPSPYENAVSNGSDERRERRQAFKAQAGETGSEMMQAIDELRAVADRVERLIGEARSLAHGGD